MTCKEYLKAVVDPLYTDEEVDEIVNNECPSEHVPIASPDYCGKGSHRCDECWNREVPFTADDEREFKYEHTGEPIGKVKEVTGCFEGLEFKVERVPSTIKDSGDRTEFATGAVRDMRAGKGRCDLMPLEVVSDILASPIIECIKDFLDSENTNFLYAALSRFAIDCYNKDAHYERTIQVEATMLLEVAKHFEEGAKKYGENNWQKGIPVHCYIDSAIRHYLKWLRGDKDEPHDRAFVWNLMCCIWEVDYHNEEK